MTKVDDEREAGKQPRRILVIAPSRDDQLFTDDDSEARADDAAERARILQRLRSTDPTRWLIESEEPLQADIERVQVQALADASRVLQKLGAKFQPFGEFFHRWLAAFQHGSNDEYEEADALLSDLTGHLRARTSHLYANEHPVDAGDYAGIRRALERADGYGDHRALAYGAIRLSLERKPKPTGVARDVKDLAADIEDAITGARFEGDDASANRHRAALRVLLVRGYGFTGDEAQRFAKKVFAAPAKAKRRAAARPRKP